MMEQFSGHSGYYIQEIARRTTFLLNEALNPLGITYAQFRVLNCLWKRGSLTQKQIHELIAVRPSTLTGLVTLLAGKGMLRRRADAEDARVNRISLLEKGEALQGPAWEVVEAFEARMTRGMGDGDKRNLIRSLQIIDGNLK